jgi:hypothetical protein
MARKIKDADSKETAPGRGDIYPWLRLLDLDFQRSERQGAPRGRGRPRNPFPRQAVHVTLTSDELAALDAVVDLLAKTMAGSVHRGNLIAFMTFRLYDQLTHTPDGNPPEGVDTFTRLAAFLDAHTTKGGRGG